MRRPSEAEARWLRSVAAGDIGHEHPRSMHREPYYADGNVKAADRGVLTRMRKKGWLTHDYDPENPTRHKVTLTAEGREAYEKIATVRS